MATDNNAQLPEPITALGAISSFDSLLEKMTKDVETISAEMTNFEGDVEARVGKILQSSNDHMTWLQNTSHSTAVIAQKAVHHVEMLKSECTELDAKCQKLTAFEEFLFCNSMSNQTDQSFLFFYTLKKKENIIISKKILKNDFLVYPFLWKIDKLNFHFAQVFIKMCGTVDLESMNRTTKKVFEKEKCLFTTEKNQCTKIELVNLILLLKMKRMQEKKEKNIQNKGVLIMSKLANFHKVKNRCTKILAIGRNYVAHIKELNNAVPSQPVIFMKPPSSIISSGQSIVMPYQCRNLHHEVELAVVISKHAPMNTVTEKNWQEYIGGYCVALDMTARDIQDDLKNKALPWTLAKAFDTGCPLGPLVDAANVDVNKCRLKLTVTNAATKQSEVRQDGTCDLMIFKIPQLISFVNKYFSLNECDIILTGTLYSYIFCFRR
ncbi:hypothetical protein RFI_36417 [Reticulomyxa filosa]|uniref:Fumarylacetoacetase-like C-terminal domain-containing protein n=1 Tax=Reticulomyxa filosa TaxID=46433 RepID=X6LHE9_RETFI|nr:hypothetical protein RFI_36417 [Reticulomyxa filosa]|eukprot:ETO01024.1 hypothetical protein RFI_36417 [Reticulomyxa filosa]